MFWVILLLVMAVIFCAAGLAFMFTDDEELDLGGRIFGAAVCIGIGMIAGYSALNQWL